MCLFLYYTPNESSAPLHITNLVCSLGSSALEPVCPQHIKGDHEVLVRLTLLPIPYIGPPNLFMRCNERLLDFCQILSSIQNWDRPMCRTEKNSNWTLCFFQQGLNARLFAFWHALAVFFKRGFAFFSSFYPPAFSCVRSLTL